MESRPQLDRQLTGIVLAGGKSSRMGEDKGLIVYRNRRLVEYPVTLLKEYCSEIIISSNNSDYQQFGLPVVPDKVPEKGPLSGIVSAFTVSSGEWLIVLPCDCPFIHRDLIGLLLAENCGCKGVVPVHHGFAEPLTAIYHKSVLPLFTDALERNRLSLQDLIREPGMRLIPVDDLLMKHPRMFRNFNSPEDLE